MLFSAAATDPPPSVDRATPPRRQRVVLWGALIVLLLAAQALLVSLALHYRSSRMQAAVEENAGAAVDNLVSLLQHGLQDTLALPGHDAPEGLWRERAQALLLARPEILRLERRDATLNVVDAVDTRSHPILFLHMPRQDTHVETELACGVAQRRGGPTYSRSFFVPQNDGMGQEVMDLCIADRDASKVLRFIVASYSLAGLLDQLAAQQPKPGDALSFVEADGSRLAHSRSEVGAGVYTSNHLVELPGMAMLLHANSRATRPGLLPDLVTSLVIFLSLGLLSVVALLARDVRKRGRAEAALADALAFRQAMEDSVVTGLRARDLQGRTTYVNPAFCAMVGFQPAELLDLSAPPYWPAEQVTQYKQRQQTRHAAMPFGRTKEAFETLFVRKSGDSFPVMVYEAPLLDSAGRHTGWMSAVLDLSAQRRVEEIARQQQDRLQATARLATVGEMASLLSHELNQPLSAIAAYATGSLNMIDDAAAADPGAAPTGAELPALLRQASQRIAEQAERAGRVIKSVHDFVRRREQVREAVAVDVLIDAILPLVKLQARKSHTRIELDIEDKVPRVLCDQAMVEQVLLNLTRNGIQAMQDGVASDDRVLRLSVQAADAHWVRVKVCDRGPGVASDVAAKLFTPFFTTRADGMGLGLSMCRTIVEQHGGALTFANQHDENGRVVGAEFRFTLPAVRPAGPRRLAPAAAFEPSAHPDEATLS